MPPSIPVSLPASLRMETADALYAEITAALREDPDRTPMILDASNVQSFGAAGIQLLLSAHKTARSASRPLQLVQLPEPFREAWEVLGLAPQLTALTETQANPEEA